MLLAYTVHKGVRDLWKVGINGNGYAYGSMFHKNIAQAFFEAASDPASSLHGRISASIREGGNALEGVIRENIFIPFLDANSENYTSGQIMAMAKGVSVWVRAMSEFFSLIPSLTRSPERFMQTVFIPPEQTLRAYHDCPEGRLIVSGRYDALLFNPDRGEARLFEFKGYTKSDVTVPLSQSLIYSWLVWKHTGIVPSVEIIYLDDADRDPEIFPAQSVWEMICAGLPGLFRAAFGVMSLKWLPEIVRDKNLCVRCPFSDRCADDWRNLTVRKRKGVSLLNVMVFMMFAVMITSQVFFFAKWSADSSAEERELMMYRIHLDSLVEEGKTALENKSTGIINHVHIGAKTFSQFSSDAKVFDNSGLSDGWKQDGYKDTYHIRIYDLDYTFDGTSFTATDRKTWTDSYGNTNACYKVFAAMQPLSYDTPTITGEGEAAVTTHNYTIRNRFYLIRAWAKLPENYYGRRLMYQLLVSRDELAPDTRDEYYNVDTLSFQEVWF